MATIDKKNGNLRGVTGNVQRESGDWDEIQVQGWVIIRDNGEYGFVLNTIYDGKNSFEIILTKNALTRILGAVQEREVGVA